MSSMGSSTAVYLYTPQKSWFQNQLLASILLVSNQTQFLYRNESQANMQVVREDVFQPALIKVWSFIPVPLLFKISLCLHPYSSSGEVQFLKSSLTCEISLFLIR